MFKSSLAQLRTGCGNMLLNKKKGSTLLGTAYWVPSMTQLGEHHTPSLKTMSEHDLCVLLLFHSQTILKYVIA